MSQPDKAWLDASPAEWLVVAIDDDPPGMTERLKVPNGWLYRHILGRTTDFTAPPGVMSLCFVPWSSGWYG